MYRGVHPKVLYEVWLESERRKNPDFKDENPIQTQSDMIEMVQSYNNSDEPETRYVELENHMVIGDYYDDDDDFTYKHSFFED